MIYAMMDESSVLYYSYVVLLECIRSLLSSYSPHSLIAILVSPKTDGNSILFSVRFLGPPICSPKKRQDSLDARTNRHEWNDNAVVILSYIFPDNRQVERTKKTNNDA